MKRLYYRIDKCLGCRSCEIACAVAHAGEETLFCAIKQKVLPRKKVYFFEGKNFPLSCLHCKEHPCVDACMAGALVYDKEKGLVIHNEERCVGCWICVMVCPYGAIRPDINRKIPVRCDKCKNKDEPACVKACPTTAILWQEEDFLLEVKK
ncbi:MAG: 4Fe-4S dicluster domain-containing protein [Candidatus Omnitrophica bacterium]|nr:4Fe-4S dicluster domain-containing protein [Candidatus Omnitrophota bacterium]MCM8799729.1 4Fe-4S dicluster domain-containing protein [Candidatus Omnitrophota bacterium]